MSSFNLAQLLQNGPVGPAWGAEPTVALSPEQRAAAIAAIRNPASGGGSAFNVLGGMPDSYFNGLSDADLWSQYVAAVQHSTNPSDASLDFVGPGVIGLAGGAAIGGALGGTSGAASGTTSPMLLADAGTTLTDVAPGLAAESSAPLGTGISAGSTATGIGGGAAGTGLTAGTTTGGVGGGALGAGVTGPGTALGAFGAESLYPIVGGAGAAAGATQVGGASAGATGVGSGTAAAAGGGSALSRIVNGNASTGDWANLLGTLGAAGLGAYGSNEQSNRLRAIYDDMAAKRQPFLDKSLQYLNDPASYAAGPGATTLDAVLRKLSVNGNPAGNPTSLGIATQAGLTDWRNAVTGFGNLGLSGEDTRANVATNAATAANNVYGDIGYGIGAVTQPRRRTLADYLGGLV